MYKNYKPKIYKAKVKLQCSFVRRLRLDLWATVSCPM